LAAFERAVRLGYRYLETDVRVTSDGMALAFHDGRLDRVTDHRGRIGELPWVQVQRARIAGREPIPTLVELLDAWPDTRINIDVKHESCVGPTIEAIRRTNAVSRVCVAAFAEARIAAVRRILGPELTTAVGPAAVLGLRFGRVPRTAARCVQVPVRIGRRPFVHARYVAAAHAAGLHVHVWTVNDRAEMIRLLDLGVDGIMTDAADVLRDVLVERGQWRG
jgi:glycerophosphoryl diester phosphodiesterase